ncbi:MAG: glycosyltransferase family 4 protein [Ferruginibacter sp.]
MNRKKIGLIVQRYGMQVNGGAEVLARMLAEKLILKYDVTVLTSCALDYHDWKPEFREGESIENGVTIMRFKHTAKAAGTEVNKLNRQYKGKHLYQKFYRFIGTPTWYLKIFPTAEITEKDGMLLVENEGPAVYGLVRYLKEYENEYDVFIFFTYLYYPSVAGLLAVSHKSIFIPTMHNEKAAYYPIYKKTMASPKLLMFLTEPEKDFSNKIFDIAHIKQEVISVGIDPVDDIKDSATIKGLGINGKYIVYVGRVEPSKGCDVLLEYFVRFIKTNNIKLTLVLAGKNTEIVFNHPQIIFTGFISHADKEQLMKQAEALVMPSKFESLSLVMLESFACKVPVIANAESDVLKDHINKSNGGWIYNNFPSFSNALNSVIENENNEEKGLAGYRYVMENYTWEKVLTNFDNAIAYVAKNNQTD